MLTALICSWPFVILGCLYLIVKLKESKPRDIVFIQHEKLDIHRPPEKKPIYGKESPKPETTPEKIILFDNGYKIENYTRGGIPIFRIMLPDGEDYGYEFATEALAKEEIIHLESRI